MSKTLLPGWVEVAWNEFDLADILNVERGHGGTIHVYLRHMPGATAAYLTKPEDIDAFEAAWEAWKQGQVEGVNV